MINLSTPTTRDHCCGDPHSAAKASAVLLASAATPLLLWFFQRIDDGDGALFCLIPAVAFLSQLKGKWSDWKPWPAVFTAAVIFFSDGHVPKLLIASFAVVATVLWVKRHPTPATLLLGLCALPSHAALDFYFGHGLRWVSARLAATVLDLTPLDVQLRGVQLLLEETVVSVDPACSGLNTLWMVGLACSFLAAIYRLDWLKSGILLGLAVSGCVLANCLRVSILFFPESGLVDWPDWTHEATGLFTYLLLLVGLMTTAHRLQYVCFARFRFYWSIAVIVALALALGLTIWVFTNERMPTRTCEGEPSGLSLNLDSLALVSLTADERRFAAHFPGTISCYGSHNGRERVIVRRITRPSRKLHPSGHCLRAEGFTISDQHLVRKSNGETWLAYNATRGLEEIKVEERISSLSGQGSWTDYGAWFWSASLRRSVGPWEAVTILRKV